MSAVVCGKRLSFFEDHTVPASSSPSPPASKRTRCFSSSSPVQFQTVAPPSRVFALDRLVALFPDMDNLVLEKTLNQCGDDIETTIKILTELRLVSNENAELAVGKESEYQNQTQGVSDVETNKMANNEAENAQNNRTLIDGAEWVDLFVREMASASNIDDARARAAKALEMLEKSIFERITTEASGLKQENMMMKEQLQVLIQENFLLKRAVAIQHERQKEFEDRGQELHNLKQMVSQYQEQLRTLEVNNYSLTMHLKQAQQGGSIPGHFHPDVF